MPKREIMRNADFDTRFVIIMEGLVQNTELVPPKDGRYDPTKGPNKWSFYQEKADGMTEGFLVRKNAPSSKKSQNVWLYKGCFNQYYEWYFYESFGEIIGSELFRYLLADRAPKNRMTQIPGAAPGIVSKYLPKFSSFKAQLSTFDDEESRNAFVKKIPTIDGIPEIIAATCFLNDFDGKFANLGTMLSDDGEKHAARIDFGCTLSNLDSHTYAIGLYLFNEGEFSDMFNHASTYAPLIDSKLFQNAILELSQINMDHVSQIVSAAVRRFVLAWQNIPLDEKAINKLYQHLFGADKSAWQCGYQAGPPVQMNFEIFSNEITHRIIDSLTQRKDIFYFFSRALTLKEVLRNIETSGSDGIDPELLEQCAALHQDAQTNTAKSYLLSKVIDQNITPQLTMSSI